MATASRTRRRQPMRRRVDPPALRAAWWALRATRSARRGLARYDLDGAIRRLPPVPPLPDPAARGVRAVLARRDDTCLVRAMVLQAWEAAHGRPCELVIGVTSPADGFQAHAWVDSDPTPEGYAELMRRPAS